MKCLIKTMTLITVISCGAGFDLNANAQNYRQADQVNCSGGNCEAIAIASEAEQLVRGLRDYMTLAEYGTYLLPVKKNAGYLRAIAMARPSGFSVKLTAKLRLLFNELKRIENFVESKMEVEALYQQMVDITSLKEQIDADLD